MTDDPTTSFYQHLYQNLRTLKQREARYRNRQNIPPDLLGQIEAHEKAIFLTRQYLDSLISERDWRIALKSLRLADISADTPIPEEAVDTQPTDSSGEISTPTPSDYHRSNIRELLTKGFSDTELRNFCFDQPEFQEVYDQLGEMMGKKEIVTLLLKHADQHLLFDQLLAWAKQRNPARYKRHQPYILQRHA
jgi:hypothetical protein